MGGDVLLPRKSKNPPLCFILNLLISRACSFSLPLPEQRTSKRLKSAFESFVTGVKESEKRLNKPYGIAVYNGKIYVCDTNDTVIVFDLEKRTYGPLHGAQGMGKLLQPFNISIDADGNKYVTDTVRRQIIVFDKNDFYSKTFGIPETWKPVDAVPFEDRALCC